jgi:nitroimidazol reductase NimA-like FMN-containing flavoprotein (pyridoxamine 5'-phosphate oxidase superfamily)
MIFDRHGVEILGREECLRLLATAATGRLGLSAGALPVVYPVYFRLLGSDPVFRTPGATGLASSVDGQVVCLEVDQLKDDPDVGGWSVMVTGVGTVLRNSRLVACARRLDIPRWPGDGDEQFVRITADLVSGRRLQPALPAAPAS